MGVDPGLTRCGLSVIESGRGRNVIALDVDVVRTPADQPLAKRLLTISDTVEHWMDTHRPDVQVQISAPDNEAVNVGQIVGGHIGIYAGAIRNECQRILDGLHPEEQEVAIRLAQGRETPADAPVVHHLLVRGLIKPGGWNEWSIPLLAEFLRNYAR